MRNLILIFVVVMLFSSCGTTTKFVTNVNSFGSDSEFNSKNYFILSSDSLTPLSKFEYLEYTHYLEKALSENGYNLIADINDADVIISFTYGISDPKTYVRKVSVPIWGQTGYNTTTTKSTVTVDSKTNKTTYNQTTTNTPTYGVVGTKMVDKTVTEYFRYTHITAYDYKSYTENQEMRIIWDTEITSKGTSDDLRKVMPCLIFTGRKYLGKSSGEKKQITLYDNNLEYIKFKKD
jgi:hypothetical protein